MRLSYLANIKINVRIKNYYKLLLLIKSNYFILHNYYFLLITIIISFYGIMKNTYQLLKNEIILCEYCHAHSNLYNINNHLKSKKCQLMKKLFLESKQIEDPYFDNKYILYLNELRKKALREEYNEDEKH